MTTVSTMKGFGKQNAVCTHESGIGGRVWEAIKRVMMRARKESSQIEVLIWEIIQHRFL